MGASKGKERKKGAKEYLKKYEEEPFQISLKKMNVYIQKVHQTANRINSKRYTLIHIKSQRLSGNLEKTAREVTIMYDLNKINTRFTIRNHRGQETLDDTFKVLEKQPLT